MNLEQSAKEHSYFPCYIGYFTEQVSHALNLSEFQMFASTYLFVLWFLQSVVFFSTSKQMPLVSDFSLLMIFFLVYPLK